MRSRDPAFTGSGAPPVQVLRFWMRAPAAPINLAAPISAALLLMREHFKALVHQLDAVAEATT